MQLKTVVEKQDAMTSRRIRRYVCTRHTTFSNQISLRGPASKYKEYNKLRSRSTAPAAPQTPSKRKASRGASGHDAEQTPKGPPKFQTLTPLKRKREEDLALDAIPQSPEFLSPQGPSVIGPTPQRDGIVLGLFDLLPTGTPSKRRAVLGDVELNVLQTPSRKTQEAASEASLESRARGERTPLSAGKQRMLNQFLTPQKRKIDEQGTPSSTMRGLATPAFLRRGNALGAIDEADETTPRPAPWKRRGLGRSLSAMIQAMKKDENDKLDEEADIMREMEMEEAGIAIPKKPRIPQIQVEDSQAPMPLGPDRGQESEDEEEEPELGPDGKPRRVWKKKGLKRQTRRVNSKSLWLMKTLPVLIARQCGPTLQNPSLSLPCRYETTQRTNKAMWQRHKRPVTQQMLIQKTTFQIMQATSRIRQGGAKRQRRRRRLLRSSQKKGRSRLLRVKSRQVRMRTIEDSKSRAKAEMVAQRANLAGGDSTECF